MSINSHISWSGCFSWHTKCHRAFDESLRPACVTANKLKRAKTCCQTGKSFTFNWNHQKKKTVTLAMQTMDWERDNQPAGHTSQCCGSRHSSSGEKDQSPCRGCLEQVPEPREALWRSLAPSWLQNCPGMGHRPADPELEWEVNLFGDLFALERGKTVLLKKAF